MGAYQDLTDVEVDIVGVKKDVKSLEHRMENQDSFNEDIRKIATSVELLAQEMKQMLETQDEQKDQLKEQDAKIQEIMMQPAHNWTNMQRTIFTTIIGAFAGALVTVLIKLI